MALDDPIEVDLEKAQIERRLNEILDLLKETGKESKLRLVKELAEDLGKHYNVDLKIKDRKENEIISKKIIIDVVSTVDIRKWLDFS